MNESGGWDDSAKHGWVDDEGDTLLLRCRASKLPEGCATEVTDRRGVVLVPGQKVFVLQTDKTRIATVVEVTEKRSSNGWWVDVDFGSGPEGIPSDILEVCNAPATPSSTEAILGDPVGGVTMQKAEDPDEWVVLDPVKYADHVPRVGIDEFSTGNGAWIRQEPGHGNNTIS